LVKTINVQPDKGNVAIMWTVNQTGMYNNIDKDVHNDAMDALITQAGNFIPDENVTITDQLLLLTKPTPEYQEN
jgi:hypothetical protein